MLMERYLPRQLIGVYGILNDRYRGRALPSYMKAIGFGPRM